ncbi:DUF1419 domain-containing protein [Sphingobium sp. H39-3-25]|uniref:DUF1419 domain-containing protein n=1 Tax=Sphingomonadales TaxID=204457 RepID=UPI000831B8DC|nr:MULTISPECIES: DUF1419 domain-containing protein [Sphingomonadaceae]MDF0491467.1 DUF1419 domain-containing protein [Sphingomonas pollutisoli]MDF0544017.1 DUF1419 domain-containing protein [Sphingobium arseniciresistens]
MTSYPEFRKILDGVATRQQMFELFNACPEGCDEDCIRGTHYTGRWFEITEDDYESMFEVLPPIFLGTMMFAMSEAKAGTIRYVFFAITILGRQRWFHGYCDMADRNSPHLMRAAILASETNAHDGFMTREEKLEAIWENTDPDFRGIASDSPADAWPSEYHGRKTIVIYEAARGTVLKLLDHLTDFEIEERLYLTRPKRLGTCAASADVLPR